MRDFEARSEENKREKARTETHPNIYEEKLKTKADKVID